MTKNNKDKYDYGPKSFGLSARTSWFDPSDSTLPGPGQHQNIRLNKTNPPQWRVGKDTQRDTFLDKFHFQYPPPTNYNPKFSTTQRQPPTFSIPQANDSHLSKHHDQNNSLLYQPSYYVGKRSAPKYSLGYFEQNDYSKPVPAPGQYHRETQRSFFNRTQNGFSVGDRPLPYGEESKWPAPGVYKVEEYRPPTYQYSIGKADRPEPLNGPDAPGVFYEIRGNMTKISNGKTMAPQYPSSDSKKDNFPSPDKYTPIHLQSRRKIITTYANRSPLQNTAVLQNPSPQKYSTQTDFYKRKSYSFTKDSKDKSQSILTPSPGPGAHDIVAQLSSRSGVMGKKLKQQAKFITPAADHYQPNKNITQQSSPRIVNYYSNRVDFSKSLTGKKIGPGSYKVEQQPRLYLGKISKSLKFPKDSNRNPGPGSYIIPSGIGKLPQYYSGTKKVTDQGYSTFTLQQWEKEKRNRQKLEEIQREEQKVEEDISKKSSINN